MDPFGTLVSIATIAVTLQEFADSFEEAPASLLSIKAQIKVVETGVKRVQEWLHFTDPTSRAEVQDSLHEAIATVDASVRSLKDDLDSVLYSGPKATRVLGRQGSDRWTRTKFAWNEKILTRHLTDMRECALLLVFTLTVCQLPTGRPAEHAIEELGSGARTLNRAHKSTRDKRRSMLTQAKTDASRDQSDDFKVFIEGVLAAENDLPEEDDTKNAVPHQDSAALAATRQHSQDFDGNSAPCVGFMDSRSVAAYEFARPRNDELFLETPTDAPQPCPVVPLKVSHSVSRKPLPSKTVPSTKPADLIRSRTENTPKILADPAHRFTMRAVSTPDVGISKPAANTSSPLERKPLPRDLAEIMSSLVFEEPLEGNAKSTQSLGNAIPETNSPAPSRGLPSMVLPIALHSDAAGEEQLTAGPSSDLSQHETYTDDSWLSSPPPYVMPTTSQLSQPNILDSGGYRDPAQAPIPISAEAMQPMHLTSVKSNADASDCPALVQAARRNEEDLVKSLLDQGADTEAQEPNTGCTALMEAARLSRREICRMLLKSGSNSSQKDAEGRTALHMASARNDSIVCRILLDAGAQVSACDLQGYIPLQTAVQAGSHEAVACILESTPISKPNEHEVLGAFLEAVKLGDIASAQEFLVKHINLKTIKDPYRLASCAAQSGSVQMLDLVLARREILKATGPDGFTALHHAARQGDPAVIKRLLDMGVSWKTQTKRRKDTALHLAIAAHQPLAASALIQHKDAKVTTTDADNQEPIHIATRIGDFNTVTSLLSRGARLKSQNSYGWKPLHLAAAYGHAALIAEFITHGVDPEDRLASPSFKPSKKTNEAARRGYWAEIRWPHEEARALHLAIEFGHLEIVKLLLASGAKYESPDAQRWQPLHYAAFNCSPELVSLLLDRGASPHATTQDGNTPLTLGFREHGLAASDDAKKAQVQRLLQAASEKRSKSYVSHVRQFRLGGASMRSARERNLIYHTAEMAEALYRDRGPGSEQEQEHEQEQSDRESQYSDDRRPSGMSSALTLSSAHTVDRRTSSLSLLRR